MTVAMLVLAAGRGTRFGGPLPKAYVEVVGQTILERSIRRLAAVTADREIVLAVHPDDRATLLAPLLPRLEEAGLTRVVDGGATRQESMQRALAGSGAGTDLVLVHDAARPFFPIEAARTALARARDVGAALLAIPASDTLKRVDPARRVVGTVDRSEVWYAQTPQVARRAELERALRLAAASGFVATDDVALLEHAGVAVEVVLGAATNLKLTTPEDLVLARALAEMV